MKQNYDHLLLSIKEVVANAPEGYAALDAAMKFLHENAKDFYWVGIYFLKGETLHLGPYYGPTTDHLSIPIGRGVCGTAIAEKQNQIIDDVRDLSNYLACNLETRSEIVVLIKDSQDQILGQIDVDSTRVSAFGREEEIFLSKVADILAPHMVQ